MNIFSRKTRQSSDSMANRLTDTESPLLTRDFLDSLIGNQFSMFLSDGNLAIERIGSNPIVGTLKSVDLYSDYLIFSFDDFVTPIFESRTESTSSSSLKEEPGEIKSFKVLLEEVSATRMGSQVILSFNRDCSEPLYVSMLLCEITG